MNEKNQKVIVGIVAKHTNINQSRINSLIRDEVKQAIFDNGGIAIGILSPNDEILYAGNDWKKYVDKIRKLDIISQLNLCDGIILQGGTTCEAYENWIAKYCYDNDIPILGICAGQNGIARGLGGTTFKISNPNKHDRNSDEYVHKIIINKDSKFYSIVQKEEMMVNSRHKNSIKDCPKLNKVAFCEDGYSDVIEAPDKKFYIGVRFHPESLYKKDKNMNNIFRAFLDSCKNRRINN